MKSIYGYMIHSDRVKKQIERYAKCNKYFNKYIILKPCIELERNNVYVKSYN